MGKRYYLKENEYLDAWDLLKKRGEGYYWFDDILATFYDKETVEAFVTSVNERGWTV